MNDENPFPQPSAETAIDPAEHSRLFDELKDGCEYRPDTLEGLMPLYRAVHHGCRAGRVREAFFDVFIDRILRGSAIDGNFSGRALGAIEANLGAISEFFELPFTVVHPQLDASDEVFLLNLAAFHLRSLGHLREGLAPTRAAIEEAIRIEEWGNAAGFSGNLAELLLTIGEVAEALAAGERAVALADRSGDLFWQMTSRATFGEVLHRAGNLSQARGLFLEAEGYQAARQPFYPQLYSMAGVQFCDLLLAPAESAAAAGKEFGTLEQEACDEVQRRLQQLFEWLTPEDTLLDVALLHLVRGRLWLYTAILQGQPQLASDWATDDLEAAIAGLRAAGTRDLLTRGLITRAWLRAIDGDGDGSWADLQEAQWIAAQGEMRLYLADIALYRARLFAMPAALDEAKHWISSCGFFRRYQEMLELEASFAQP